MTSHFLSLSDSMRAALAKLPWRSASSLLSNGLTAPLDWNTTCLFVWNLVFVMSGFHLWAAWTVGENVRVAVGPKWPFLGFIAWGLALVFGLFGVARIWTVLSASFSRSEPEQRVRAEVKYQVRPYFSNLATLFLIAFLTEVAPDSLGWFVVGTLREVVALWHQVGSAL